MLVIPRKHYCCLTTAATEDPTLVGRLMQACVKVAKLEGLTEDGYRVVTNIGVNGAQTVRHLHLHVLGGVKMSEKMS